MVNWSMISLLVLFIVLPIVFGLFEFLYGLYEYLKYQKHTKKDTTTSDCKPKPKPKDTKDCPT